MVESFSQDRATHHAARPMSHINAEVHRFDGTINRYTGDGVMALSAGG
jgi:class 3 adenylate cyclase